MKGNPIQFSEITEGMDIAFYAPDGSLLYGKIKTLQLDTEKKIIGCEVVTTDDRAFDLEQEDKIFYHIKKEGNVKDLMELTKYPALKTMIGVISFFGYSLIISGVIAFIYLATKDQPLNGFYAFLASAIIALPMLAFANLIYVFIDIEYNSRKTIDVLKDVVNKL